MCQVFLTLHFSVSAKVSKSKIAAKIVNSEKELKDRMKGIEDCKISLPPLLPLHGDIVELSTIPTDMRG